MLGIGAGEVMSARKIFLGAHIHEVVVHVVQHGIYSLHTRHSYWSGRQSNVSISVVGTFYANFIVGSACKGIPAFSLFIYMPAIAGFSALLAVSSSTIEAKVQTS